MRPLRVILSALIGATVMFVWGALSHMLIIKGVGFKPLPNDGGFVSQMNQAIPDDGLYFFPGIDFAKRLSNEEAAALDARFRGAHGLVIIRRGSDGAISARKLGLQFSCDFLALLIAILIATQLPQQYWKRALAIGGMGIFGCLGVSSINWIWYGFGDLFFAAHCFDKIMGWMIVGFVIAPLLKTSQIKEKG